MRTLNLMIIWNITRKNYRLLKRSAIEECKFALRVTRLIVNCNQLKDTEIYECLDLVEVEFS